MSIEFYVYISNIYRNIKYYGINKCTYNYIMKEYYNFIDMELPEDYDSYTNNDLKTVGYFEYKPVKGVKK